MFYHSYWKFLALDSFHKMVQNPYLEVVLALSMNAKMYRMKFSKVLMFKFLKITLFACLNLLKTTIMFYGIYGLICILSISRHFGILISESSPSSSIDINNNHKKHQNHYYNLRKH